MHHPLRLFHLLLLATLLGHTQLPAQPPGLLLQKPHQQPISQLTFNPYHQLLYSFSTNEKLLKIWNPSSGKLVQEVDLGFATAPAVTLLPHGQSLLVFDNDSTYLLHADGTPFLHFPRTEDQNLLLDSETGQLLITQQNGTAELLLTSTGQRIPLLTVTGGSPFYRFNPGGTLTVSITSTVYVFDSHTGRCLDSMAVPHSAYGTFPRIGAFFSQDRQRWGLVTDTSFVVMAINTHDTLSRCTITRNRYSGFRNCIPSGALDKLLLIDQDTLRVYQARDGRLLTQQPAALSPLRVDAIGNHLVQFNSFGRNYLFDWQQLRFVFVSGLLMDDGSHLSGHSTRYALSPDGQYLWYANRDSLLRRHLSDPVTTTGIKIPFSDGIKNICTDPQGLVYITGANEQNTQTIGLVDPVTLSLRTTIPATTGNAFQYHTILQLNAAGDILTGGFGLAIKQWRLSNTAVQVVPHSTAALAIDSNTYVVQDDRDTGKIVLQLRQLRTNRLLKEITTPVYNGIDFFREGIFCNGHVLLPTNYSELVYDWDTSSNSIRSFALPNGSGGVLTETGPYLLLQSQLGGAPGILKKPQDKVYRAPYFYKQAMMLAVAPAQQQVAWLREEEPNANFDPINYTLTLEHIETHAVVQRLNVRLNPANFTKLVFSADGNWLALAGNQGVVAWQRKGAAFQLVYADTADVYLDVTDCCFNPTASHLYYTGANKQLRMVELSTLAVKTIPLISIPVRVVANAQSIVIGEQGNLVQVIDAQQQQPRCLLIDHGEEDWQVLLPNGYYFASKHISRQVGYRIWPDYYDFRQFDARYNRPDLVARALNPADTVLAVAFFKAYLKRLQRLQIDTLALQPGAGLPYARILNAAAIPREQATDQLTLHIAAGDSTNTLRTLQVYVNEVPLYGQDGFSLAGRRLHQLDTTFQIQLSTGNNQVEAAVTDERGLESYRIPAFVHVNKVDTINTWFVGIGVDQFADTTHNLQYSCKDIRDQAQLWKQRLGARVQIDTLFNEQVTVAAVRRLKERLYKTGVNDRVVIAYSGHGLLSDSLDYYLSTWAVDFAHPERNGLPYGELENLLDGIPARKKLLLIDACHSGEVDRSQLSAIKTTAGALGLKGAKGGIVTSNGDARLGLNRTFELMQTLFANVGRNTGATVIAAAGGFEYALEGVRRFPNGIFTHCVLEAMQQEATMTVSQFRDRVTGAVEALTGGLQRPNARTETMVVDWVLWE